MGTTASINLQTDQWLANRDYEIRDYELGGVLLDDYIRKGYTVTVGAEEAATALFQVIGDLTDLHSGANVSLADIEERLHAIRYAAQYLLSTL